MVPVHERAAEFLLAAIRAPRAAISPDFIKRNKCSVFIMNLWDSRAYNRRTAIRVGSNSRQESEHARFGKAVIALGAQSFHDIKPAQPVLFAIRASNPSSPRSSSISPDT
jgi:hypothetical protein